MAKAQKGSEYYCGECGTTLLVTDVGCAVPQSVVCCEVPMIVRISETKAKPKKKAKKK
jgi:hypothetical protein